MLLRMRSWIIKDTFIKNLKYFMEDITIDIYVEMLTVSINNLRKLYMYIN